MALQPDATAAPQVMGASTEQNIYITYVQYMLIYVYCYCLFFFVDSITMFEDTVYFVLKKNLTMSPEWSAQLEVFSVWEQEHQVLNFRLCKENHAA